MTADPIPQELQESDIEDLQRAALRLCDRLRLVAGSAINATSRHSTNSELIVDQLLDNYFRGKSTDTEGINPDSIDQFLAHARGKFCELLRKRHWQEKDLQREGLEALDDPASWRVLVDLVRRKKEIPGISLDGIVAGIGELQSIDPGAAALLSEVVIFGRSPLDLQHRMPLTGHTMCSTYDALEAAFQSLVKQLRRGDRRGLAAEQHVPPSASPGP